MKGKRTGRAGGDSDGFRQPVQLDLFVRLPSLPGAVLHVKHARPTDCLDLKLKERVGIPRL